MRDGYRERREDEVRCEFRRFSKFSAELYYADQYQKTKKLSPVNNRRLKRIETVLVRL